MNIDFYQQCTDNLPFYIENIGDIVLYCNTFSGLIKLNPGERKKVSEENAEKEKIDLPSGDLYPAIVIPDDENDDWGTLMGKQSDSLGDRMNSSENISRNYLTRRIPVIIRINEFKRNFDESNL